MSVKATFNQADRLNSKFTIILNSEDLKFNQIKIKNNETKEDEVISVDKLIPYLDEKLEDGCNCGDDCSCESDGHKCNCKK